MNNRIQKHLDTLGSMDDNCFKQILLMIKYKTLLLCKNMFTIGNGLKRINGSFIKRVTQKKNYRVWVEIIKTEFSTF